MGIPVWFLNRQRDIKDGKDSQLTSNNLDNKLREDLERMKKVRIHRGIRHHWGLRVKRLKLLAGMVGLLVFSARRSKLDDRKIKDMMLTGDKVCLFLLFEFIQKKFNYKNSYNLKYLNMNDFFRHKI